MQPPGLTSTASAPPSNAVRAAASDSSVTGSSAHGSGGVQTPSMQASPSAQHAAPHSRAAGHGGVPHGPMQRGSSPSMQQPLFGVSQKYPGPSAAQSALV